MPEAKSYNGSCHCGRVRYAVTADLTQVLECNCTHCQRKGLLLNFVPATAFSLQAGEPELVEYRFNKRHIQHLFCRNCGVQSFARGEMPDGTAMVSINVRCLEGVDITTLSPTPYNGRDA